MSAARIRGACPSLAAPMATGDGLLARLDLAGVPLSPAMLAGLCAAARAHGNGLLEVTHRGTIQIRGLRLGSVAPFREAVEDLGIVSGDGIPVLIPPLAGLDPTEDTDVRPLAAALREARSIATPGGLAPKFSVVLDGGGALHLDALAADVRLVADGVGYRLAIAGSAVDALALGSIAPADVKPTVIALVRMITAAGHVRARDLARSASAETIRARLGVPLAAPSSARARSPAEPIGLHAIGDGKIAAGVGLAFGQVDAAPLEELVVEATRAGADGFVPATSRALLSIGLHPDLAPAFLAAAEGLGFITRPADPRRFIAACAGAPDCASGKMAARRIAPEVAATLAPILDGSVEFHISGCSKGCAHPGPAAVTLVGTDRGCDVIVAGRADGVATGHVPPHRLTRHLAQFADAVSHQRRPGERTADVLRRLGPAAASLLVKEAADA